ncbi:MAG TPA: hypothetical protein PLB26_00765 [Rubrivivax sp.]|nr:hypothetical protein [Rubrivivax sp.]
MSWWKAVGIALTQLLNALCGGWPDESTSSRLYRLELQGSETGGTLRQAVDAVFGAGHCERAFMHERARRQHPPELR